MKQLEEYDVLQLTPDGELDLHSPVYAQNEEHCTNWEGNIVPPRDRVIIKLSNFEEDPVMISNMQVSAVETV